MECKSYTENGGIFASRTRLLNLVGSTRPFDALFSNHSVPGSTGYGLASPRAPMSPSHPFSGGGGDAGGGDAGGGGAKQQQRSGGGWGALGRDQHQRDNTMLGKTVRITQGEFKGYMGIVKDSTETTVRVELHSNPKTILLDRAKVMSVDAPARAPGSMHAKTPGGTSVYGGKTPFYTGYGAGGRTPMYGAGGMTPMHDGSRTPAYEGGRTPRPEGSMTPAAWDGSSTPARHTDYDIEESDLNPGARAPFLVLILATYCNPTYIMLMCTRTCV